MKQRLRTFVKKDGLQGMSPNVLCGLWWESMNDHINEDQEVLMRIEHQVF